MMKIIVHPAYFPPVTYFAAFFSAETVVFDIHAHFDKQTYRNRMYLHAAHGKQLLSVPVKHTKNMERLAMKKVKISYERNWQRQHWKTLETAYRTSPYFEFYEDDLYPLFEHKFEYLWELNLATVQKVFDLLNTDFDYELSQDYNPSPEGFIDLRPLVDAKKKFDFIKQLPPYTQVFSNKNGFIPGLSILDLLFMEGPHAVNYLKKIAPLIKP